MGLRADYPCPRPGTVRYEVRYYCKEHIKVFRADLSVNRAYDEEVIYYLLQRRS